MKELLLSMIVLLVPPERHKHAGESVTDAGERYAIIADAVAERVGDDQRLALFLLTIARHESDYRKVIHSGDMRGDHGRSWGLFQFLCGKSRTRPVPGTRYTAGDIVGTDTEHTRNAVDAAATIVGPIVTACKGNADCVFRRYGGVGAKGTTETEWRLKQRVRTYSRLRALARDAKNAHTE